MNQVAIFVDAGYLYAQGSAAITGQPKKRLDLALNVETVKLALLAISHTVAPDCRLLRIYWYDAPTASGLSLDNQLLAETNDIKLRLGILNNAGKQKGVDAMIITDMMDLARNHSVCDILLLSGDVDMQLPLQVVQTMGVRTHLLGIAAGPQNNTAQSRFLLEDTDTLSIWDATQVGQFLTYTAPAVIPAATPTTPAMIPATPAVVTTPMPTPVKPVPAEPATRVVAAEVTRVAPVPSPVMDQVPDGVTVEEIVRLAAQMVFDSLSSQSRTGILDEMRIDPGIPRYVDGQLMYQASKLLQRDLFHSEKRELRAHFKNLIRS